MFEPMNHKNSLKDIEYKRSEIFKQLMKASSNINDGTTSSISTADLRCLFELYDKIFFHNWFKGNFKGKIVFSLSKRMTKSAGLTLCPKNIDKIKSEDLVIEIRIGVDFFFHYEVLEGSKKVCGVSTYNSLHALQLVFEHELCHVLEFIHFKESSCKKERFKTMACNLFGHTESYHVLPTNQQIAREKLDLHLGDMVTFIFENKKLQGVLHNINKRGTVMVKDKKGPYKDKNGNRYAKYYVPLNLISKK